MARSDYITKLVPLRSKPDGAWLVHPDLRGRVVAQATSEGISMTETIIKILSDKCGLPFEPTPRKTTPATEGEEFNVRMPVELHKKLAHKTSWPATIQDTIRQMLCTHYGLRVPPKVKHTRRRAARAA